MKQNLAQLSVAAAYLVTAKLALLLAISPGFATAVWPPAGVAMGAVLVLGRQACAGIWLGSFLANLSLTFDSTSTASMVGSAVPAASIALGAVLQVLVADALIRRAVGSLGVERERDVLWFMLVVGPIGCLVAASIGASTLFVSGAIDAAGYGYTWATWWVGDTIGAVLFTPLVLAFFGRPADVWRRRRLPLSVAIGLGMAAVTAMFVLASRWELGRIRFEFERSTQGMADAVREGVIEPIEVIHTMADLFRLVGDVDPDRFRRLVAPALARHPAIQALEWAPQVARGERPAFEARRRAAGFAGFEIRERRSDGALVAAGERAVYYPVDLVEPHLGNELAYGYDLASDPARVRALELAWTTGEPVATEPLRLVQETGQQDGFLVIMPVAGERIGASEARLHGFVVGVFRAADLVEQVLDGVSSAHIRVHIFDAERPEIMLFARGPRTDASAAPLRQIRAIDVGWRRWLAEFTAPTGYLLAHRNWQPWAVLAAGLSFVGLLTALLLVVTGRAARVERLVDLRTGELAAANQRLTQTAAELESHAIELERARDQAEEASRSKSEFLASMSHELRTPLNSVIGFADILVKNKRGNLQSTDITYLERIAANGRHLLALINDVLDLSKVEAGRLEVDLSAVDIDELTREVAYQFEVVGSERPVELVRQIPAGLPAASADRQMLKQVLINLVGNAIKFTHEGSVTIGAERAEGRLRLSVIDTGIGIAAGDQERVFEAFRQLDAGTSRQYGGTGLGLAISRRYCQRMGLDLEVVSEPGRGSTFTIVWPVA